MTETKQPEQVHNKRGLHRRLYDWVISWGHGPYGTPALFTLSFAEASFFPIPPDVLLIPLVLAKRSAWKFFAFICTFSSVLGGLFGYWIGHVLWNEISAVSAFCFDYVPGMSEEGVTNVIALYKKWDFWVVFTAGFTIIPFKIFTIVAGIASIKLAPFILAATLGRGVRFFLVSWLVSRYGIKSQDFIERRFNLVCLLATALLIAGFVILKLLV